MRPRLRLWGGLRGRLLLALVLTSMVTLGAAAAVVLSPLQQRLRDQSIESLRAAVLAARPRFEDALARRAGSTASSRSASEAFELSDQTAGRVLATDLALTPAATTSRRRASSPTPRAARRRARRWLAARAHAQPRGDGARSCAATTSRSACRSTATAASSASVVARRRLTEVANAVEEVRKALLAAAGVGLLVAVALAVALASTLLRRLGRLRAAALRISAEGPTVADAARHRPRRGRRPRARARRACRRSCAARSRRGAPSWPPRRTSCGRR